MNYQENILLDKNIKAAIFDADGTLLDSMHIWRELGSRYLESLNIVPEKNLAEILYPMSLEQGCLYLQNKYNLCFPVNEIQSGFLRIIENFYYYEVELKQGVKKFLDSLNIPKVIATSGDQNLLQAALTRNGINKYFSKIFTCSELNTNKHEPKIFIECANFLNLKPNNIAVFEDALYALKTAKSANFITVGVEDNSNIDKRARIINICDYHVKNFIDFI